MNNQPIFNIDKKNLNTAMIKDLSSTSVPSKEVSEPKRVTESDLGPQKANGRVSVRKSTDIEIHASGVQTGQLGDSLANGSEDAVFSDVLLIEPLSTQQTNKERLRALERQLQQKHAVQIRKRLFVQSLNQALAAKQSDEKIQPMFDTVGDQLYNADLNKLLA